MSHGLKSWQRSSNLNPAVVELVPFERFYVPHLWILTPLLARLCAMVWCCVSFGSEHALMLYKWCIVVCSLCCFHTTYIFSSAPFVDIFSLFFFPTTCHGSAFAPIDSDSVSFFSHESLWSVWDESQWSVWDESQWSVWDESQWSVWDESQWSVWDESQWSVWVDHLWLKAGHWL